MNPERIETRIGKDQTTITTRKLGSTKEKKNPDPIRIHPSI